MKKDDAHTRPPNISDATVEAVGKTSEAFEWVERARGHLYEFHQLMGRADFLFEEAADMLVEAKHKKESGLLKTEVVGRNVLTGRWTFQIIEEFEDTYYLTIKDVENTIRNNLLAGKRHVYEAELKEDRRTKSHSGHESRPVDAINHTPSE